MAGRPEETAALSLICEEVVMCKARVHRQSIYILETTSVQLFLLVRFGESWVLIKMSMITPT